MLTGMLSSVTLMHILTLANASQLSSHLQHHIVHKSFNYTIKHSCNRHKVRTNTGKLLENTYFPARSLWDPLEFISCASSCLTPDAILLVNLSTTTLAADHQRAPLNTGLRETAHHIWTTRGHQGVFYFWLFLIHK